MLNVVSRIPHSIHSSYLNLSIFFRSCRRGQTSRHLTTQTSPRSSISGIWYVPDASITEPELLISKLPRLLPPSRGHLTTAIFFATPSIAKWFAPGHDYLQAAINRIYRPVLEQAPPTSIFAVVEALPIPYTGQARKDHQVIPFRGAEGLALCLLSGVDTTFAQPTDSSNLPLINFHSNNDYDIDGLQMTVSASLQVANTLFINGSTSMVFRQVWKVGGVPRDRKWEPDEPPQQLSQVSVPLRRYPSSFMQYYNRLQVMTKPRKVVTSMGNVVREVENDDGSVIKASTELETVVPKFLKDKSAEVGHGRVEVYALLMPPQSADSTSDNGPGSLDTLAKQKSSQAGGPDESNIIRNFIRMALRAGGRLHKVTGGGGGWGKKAGLLSLDTTTNFGSESGFDIGMFPSFDDEGDMTTKSSHNEEAIPSGWSIQFLAVFIGAEQDPYRVVVEQSNAKTWTAGDWDRFRRDNLLVIGTTDAKNEQLEHGTQLQDPNHKVIAVPNVFGMLSPGGICLSKKIEKSSPDEAVTMQKLHQFRVDAPHTMFCAKFGEPGTKRDHTGTENVPGVESRDKESIPAFGLLMNAALRQSNKPVFRKIRFSREPALNVAARKTPKPAQDVQKPNSESSKPRFRIRRHLVQSRDESMFRFQRDGKDIDSKG